MAVIAALGTDGNIEGVFTETDSIKPTTVQQLLEHLFKRFPHEHVVIWWDNLWIHLSKEIKEFAAKLKIELLYNVPCQPVLNPIE